MRMRVLLVVAAGVSLAIAGYAILAPSGLPRWRELRDEERALAVEVERARSANAALAAEVKVLQGGEPTSAAVLEKVAREELGWVRKDELVITGLSTGTGSSLAPTGTSPPTAATRPQAKP